MTMTVFLTVLGAALLHAVWNALVKGGLDKATSLGAVVLGHVPIAIVVLPFVPLPDPVSYPYLAAGLACHVGYQLFLMKSYEQGDLTQVYPIARGSAPLIVAIVSVLGLGVVLSRIELLAVGIIVLGIFSLTLVRRADGQRNGRAAGLALITGCFIAGYSLIDGLGARAAGTAVGYYGWLSVINGVITLIYLALVRPQSLKQIPREGKMVFVVGGGASFLAYALVVWAFMQAPIALVTALRETSIVFALLIGVVVLKERLDLIKLFSTFTTLLGAILLRFGR